MSATPRTDADFLRELLTDWKQPFDDHESGRRTAVAMLVFDKNERARQLETELATVRQMRERAEADLADTRQRLLSFLDSQEGQNVMAAQQRDTANRLVDELQSDIAKAEADAAGLRACINELVSLRQDPIGEYYAANYMGGIGEAMSKKVAAALSSTAGAELLAERDSLRAEVARLRNELARKEKP